MTTLREAAQQALEALEWHLEKGAWGADIEGVTAALRTALAQQAEPLTEEEIIDIGKEARAVEGPHILPVTFARAIERAHGIK